MTSAVASLLCLGGASAAAAQSLGSRVTASDGVVQVIYPSRPETCGDGRGSINNVFGHSSYYNQSYCVHGPARVVADVVDHQLTRLRLYVGAVPKSDARTIDASARDAEAWLTELVTRGDGRISADAMLPLVVADGSNPWPTLLAIARDDSRSRAVRRNALNWLSMGVSEHLGIADASTKSDDDEMKEQAVFVLSQRPKAESVPELIDLARTSKNPTIRRSAIFWLGQSGDARVADLYADLLKQR
jgi:hypothetical protein